ncbi:MAG: HlyD family type I secretion periplasmic adaptor subunit [Pseudomonadota bacterium]
MTAPDSNTPAITAGTTDKRKRRQRRKSARSSRNLRFLARSIVLEEMGPPRALRQAMWAVVATVACFIMWAAVTPLAETTRAPGHVVPLGSVLTVQHLEGGIVSEILVEDGSIVEKGAVLVKLDPTAAKAELQEKRTRIAALRLETERLRAFADGRTPDFGETDPQFATLAADQQTIHKLQSESREQERVVLQHQIDQRRSELATLEQQRKALSEQVSISNELADMRQNLMKKGHVSRVVYLRTKQELAAALGEKQRVSGEIAKAKQAIAEAQGKLLELDAKRNNEAATLMGQVSAELAQLRITVSRLEDRLKRTDITAPVNGIVTGMKVHTVGGVIPPGGVIGELVPLEDELVIEARISPTDIGHLATGQHAQVVVTAYDFARFGSVQGTVDKISATTFLDEKGTVFYKAVIRMAQNFVGDAPGRNPIVPGMITEVAINTGERTLLSYLVRPVLLATDRAFSER